MEKIKIMVDTASDIDIEDAEALGIELIPINIIVDDKTYLESFEMKKEDFWKILMEREEIPATSQISPEVFRRYYKKADDEGYTHVILTTINAAGSGTFNSANLAVNLFKSDYPESKLEIAVLDSMNYTMCYGKPVMDAAEKINNKELDFKGAVEFLKDSYEHAGGYAYMSTLKFAKKSGRISLFSAVIGEALCLKPIIKLGDGKVDVVSKLRGDKAAVSKLIEHAAEEAYDIKNSELVIVTGCMPEEIVNKLYNDTMEKLKPKKLSVYKLGCAITNNAGPQTLGLLFRRK